MLKHKHFDRLKEDKYDLTLDNGLKVSLIPKPGFHKTYAVFTTNFGSIDNHFKNIETGQDLHIPDGMAHFLEHKMFATEEGDAFDRFAELGASSNAFTNFTRTSYLFSTTSNIEENISHLLDFVQTPYFTEANIEKERGIIEQEIRMYEDMPAMREMYGLLENLYPDHPVHIDIAGTVESIQEIDQKLLYDSHHAFYHPSNMTLLVIGNIDPKSLAKLVIANQTAKDFGPAPQLIRQNEVEDLSKIIPYRQENIDVVKPKLSVGIRGTSQVKEGDDFYAHSVLGDMVIELIFGDANPDMESWYKEGLIDSSFSYGYQADRGFHYLMINGETLNPEELAKRIKELFRNWSDHITPEAFQRVKKKYLGYYLQAMNSLEFVANQYAVALMRGAEFFNIIEGIESLTFEDALNFGQDLINEDYYSEFVIYPKEGTDNELAE